MKIRCESCGKRYDYDLDEACPNCGAFNQPDHQISSTFVTNTKRQHLDELKDAAREKTNYYREEFLHNRHDHIQSHRESRRNQYDNPFDQPATRHRTTKSSSPVKLKFIILLIALIMIVPSVVSSLVRTISRRIPESQYYQYDSPAVYPEPDYDDEVSMPSIETLYLDDLVEREIMLEGYRIQIGDLLQPDFSNEVPGYEGTNWYAVNVRFTRLEDAVEDNPSFLEPYLGYQKDPIETYGYINSYLPDDVPIFQKWCEEYGWTVLDTFYLWEENLSPYHPSENVWEGIVFFPLPESLPQDVFSLCFLIYDGDYFPRDAIQIYF